MSLKNKILRNTYQLKFDVDCENRHQKNLKNLLVERVLSNPEESFDDIVNYPAASKLHWTEKFRKEDTRRKNLV